jgi:hypothetical protein
MAIKKDGKYLCGYCLKPYAQQMDAEGCKDSHELLYVALSKADLNRLINFIYTKDEQLLTESLIKNLKKYMRGINK